MAQPPTKNYLRVRCPRCGGNLFLDFDAYGHFVSCLQCSKVLSEGEEQRLGLAA